MLKATETLLSILFPIYCHCCWQKTECKTAICLHCSTQLPWLINTCHQCATPLKENACQTCSQYQYAFDRVYIPFQYAPPISTFIMKLKYYQNLAFAKSLSFLLLKHLQEIIDPFNIPELIIPVPLHSKRMQKRGFNQSILIANYLSKYLRIPLNKTICRRKLNTPPQSASSANQRKKNMAGAFAMRRLLEATHIAIIDDVFTTGQTVNELSKLLKNAGASRVDIWCCARTLTDTQEFNKHN